MGIIGNIRKHSWVAVLIVGVAIVAFIIGDLSKNRNKMPDLAKINGTTVSYQRFGELHEELKANYMRQQGVEHIDAATEEQLREQVWQNLLGETLTAEQLEKLGLQVSPAELSDMFSGNFIHPYLRQLFTDPKTGAYNTQAIQYYTEHFDELDTAMRQQWMDIEKYVKTDRQQQKYTQLIAKGFYMPTVFAKDMASRNDRINNVRVAALPYQMVADEEAMPTDADYQEYYNHHRAEFQVREEMRELDFIVYPLQPTAQDLAAIATGVDSTWAEFQTISNDELAFFVNSESDRSYDSSFMKSSTFEAPIDSMIAATAEGSFFAPRMVNNHWVMGKVVKTSMRPDSLRASSIYIFNSKVGGNITRSDEQAKQLADSILAVVKNGSLNFEDAVAQYSDDPNKGDNKGDMQWQLDGAYGFLNEDIVNTPVGGVFVYKHPQEIGYFIVKVTDKTPANKKYRVALISREIVPSEATTRDIFAQANRFAGNNRTYQEMTAAAQAENLQVRNTMVTAMSTNLAGVRNAREIARWAFNDKTKVGDVADQVFESDNMYIVVALKDIYKKGYATLDQVRPMIENQVRIEKKAEVLMARAEEAKKAANDINSIAAKLNVAVDTLDSISLGNYYFGKFGMEPKAQAVISMAENNSIVGPVKGASGVYVIKVDATAKKAESTNPDMLRNQMEQAYMQKARAISQVLQDKADIKDQRNKYF